MNTLFTILQVVEGAAAATAPTWIPWLMSGLAAVGSLASSIFNRSSQVRTNEQNFAYNKHLQQQAYQQNLQMWDIQNQYNSPVAQMARLKAAGLNPNIMYGQASDVSTGNAEAAPELSYPAYQAKAPVFDSQSPIQNMFSAYQLANLESSTRKNLSESGLTDEKKITEIESRPVKIAQMQQDLENAAAQHDLILENITKAKLDNYVKEHVKDFEIEYSMIQNQLAKAQVHAVESRALLNEAEARKVDQVIAESQQRILNMQEELKNLVVYRTKIMPTQAQLNSSMARYYDSAEAKVFFEAQQEKKVLENWQTSFDTYINEMSSKYRLNQAQTQDLRWQIEHRWWTELGRPVVKGAATAGAAYLGAKGYAAGKSGPAPGPTPIPQAQLPAQNPFF